MDVYSKHANDKFTIIKIWSFIKQKFVMVDIVHAIVDDTFSFFDRCIRNTWGLGSFQNTEN